MDDTTLRFGPDRRLSLLWAGAALVAAGGAVLTTDLRARILWGGAALLLAGYAITELVYWPRLTATARGLVVHTPLARARLEWSAVDSVSADTRSRYGVRSTTLELSAGSLLVVFSRRSLGADPSDVAGLLEALRPPPGGVPG